MALYCVHCGIQLNDEGSFCHGCGKPKVGTATNLAAPAALDAAQETFPQQVAASTRGESKASFSQVFSITWKALIALLLISLGIGFIYFMITSVETERERKLSIIPENEASAVGSLRTITTAEVVYASTYPRKGFAPDLNTLGGTGTTPSSAQAQLIDVVLGCATMPCTKNGYKFTITPGAGSPLASYSVNAIPVTVGGTGNRFFYSDVSGVIRFNNTGPAGPTDTALE